MNAAQKQFSLTGVSLNKANSYQLVGQLRHMLAINPTNPAIQLNMAWLLATSKDRNARNGSEAVILAESAHSVKSRDPITKSILAGAYAECGRFTEARQAAQTALDLSVLLGFRNQVTNIQRQLINYQKNPPYYDDAPN